MEGGDDLNLNIPHCCIWAMALIGHCVIPCIWGLIFRLIETALIKQTPISYQLLLSTAEIESQIMSNEFGEQEIFLSFFHFSPLLPCYTKFLS
jgi:hypothetical protein